MAKYYELPFTDYDGAERFLHGRAAAKIGNNTWLTKNGADFVISLHGNKICQFNRKEIVLSTAGWKTSTTLHRLRGIKLALCPNYSLIVKKGEWLIQHVSWEKARPFDDSFEIDLTGKEVK